MPGDAARQGQMRGTGSFMVRVLFRQDANYQGEISWVEGGKTRYFRSLLEMLLLMQSALNEGDSEDSTDEFRSWDQDSEAAGGRDN